MLRVAYPRMTAISMSPLLASEYLLALLDAVTWPARDPPDLLVSEPGPVHISLQLSRIADEQGEVRLAPCIRRQRQGCRGTEGGQHCAQRDGDRQTANDATHGMGHLDSRRVGFASGSVRPSAAMNMGPHVYAPRVVTYLYAFASRLTRPESKAEAASAGERRG